MQEKNAKSFVDPKMTKRLKKVIKEEYKTKAKFAKEIGATYEVVRLWCDGQSKPSTDFLIAIAKNTTISIDWLLTGKEQKVSIQDRSSPNNELIEIVNRVLTCNSPEIKASFESCIHHFDSYWREHMKTQLAPEDKEDSLMVK